MCVLCVCVCVCQERGRGREIKRRESYSHQTVGGATGIFVSGTTHRQSPASCSNGRLSHEGLTNSKRVKSQGESKARREKNREGRERAKRERREEKVKAISGRESGDDVSGLETLQRRLCDTRADGIQWRFDNVYCLLLCCCCPAGAFLAATSDKRHQKTPGMAGRTNGWQ